MNIESMYPQQVYSLLKARVISPSDVLALEVTKWFNRAAANEVLALCKEIQLQAEPQTAIIYLEDHGTKEFNAA